MKPKQIKIINFIIFGVFILNALVFAIPKSVDSAINERINYQGKLTDTSGVAVEDGDYRMYFRLYTTETGGSNIWEEDRSTTAGDRITITDGLFSVMLGSSTVLSGVDFNQTLYLGVEVCGLGSGAESCDGEMTPRKVIGAVPAAFESQKLSGLNSSQFLRSDAVNSTSTTSTFLTITQNGSGKIAEFIGPSSAPVLTLLSSGKVGIGTSTPYSNLSVWGSSSSNSIFEIVDSASSTIFTALSNGNIGVGTTSPYTDFSVNGEVASDYFTSNSTTATSTFANHISIGSEKEYRIGGTGILTRKSNGSTILGDLTGDARGLFSLDIQSDRGGVATRVASGEDSVAVGVDLTSSGQGSTAVGNNSESTGLNSVAVGGLASAGGDSTIAIGFDQHAFVDYAVIIGNGSTVNSNYNIGIGNENNISTNSDRALSIGDLNEIGGGASDSVIVGSSNSLEGAESIIVGYDNTLSFDLRSTVVGQSNTVTAFGASIFGDSITNNVASSTMIGPSDSAKITILNSGNVGIGTSTPYAKLSVTGEIVSNYFTATSTTATSTFANHISIGAEKEYKIGGAGVLTKNSAGAIVIGSLHGDTRGQDAIDIQTTRTLNTATEIASGINAVAIGSRNTSSNTATLAIGSSNVASGTNTGAVGYFNEATGNNSSAFGRSNEASGTQSSAFGNRNFTSAQSAVAFGTLNNSTGATFDETTGAISGTADFATTIGINSTALGIYNNASGLRSTAIGFKNTASGIGSVAIGSNIVNSIASSTMIGPSNEAKITITSAGYLGVGTTTPIRKLDVEGTFGGKYLVRSDSLTSTQTVTVTDDAISYYFHNNTGTTDSSITITYNITGVPNNDGTIVLLRTAAEKGVTSAARTSTVTVQINGSQVSSAATSNQTGANTRILNSIFVRLNGEWRRVGNSNVDSADIAEWIEYSGDIPEAGQLLIASPSKRESAEVSLGIPYDSRLIGIVSTSPEIVMGGSGDPLEKTMLTLAGRVPTKVSTENGPIKAGDYITSSSQAGVGMKATKPGRVVGVALEDYDSGGIGEIVVLIDNSFYVGESEESIVTRLETLEGVSSSGSGGLTLNSFINSIIVHLDGLGVRIVDGLASFKEIITGKFTVGSREEPTGITLYDEITGEPYCLSIRNGKTVSRDGECQVVNNQPSSPVIIPEPQGEDGGGTEENIEIETGAENELETELEMEETDTEVKDEESQTEPSQPEENENGTSEEEIESEQEEVEEDDTTEESNSEEDQSNENDNTTETEEVSGE